VHDTAHFWRWDKNTVFEAFDAKESVASAIRAYRPFDGAAGLRSDSVRIGAAVAA
jgi:hypothetical protein